MTKGKWIFITFMISLLPKLIMSLTLHPYSIYDEFGSMASAAYIAGNDWTAALSESGAYYGFGYYIIYAPIFWLTDNPYIIYRIIVCGNAILQASCSIIAFQILERIFPEIKDRAKCLFSVTISYLMVETTVAMNETPLLFIVWISALLCVSIIQDYHGKRNLYLIMLELVLAWSLTIHTRLILLPIAIVIFSIFYRLIWKEKFFSLINYLSLLGLYILGKYVVRLFQNKMWLADKGESLGNASVDTVGYLSRFDFGSIMTWKLFLKIFIGQMGTVAVFSGGLFIVSIFVLYYYALKMVRMNKLNECKTKLLFMLAGIFGMCLFATMAGQMVTWGYQTLDAVNNNEKGNGIYKVFTYIRYWGQYMGPIVLCAMGIMYSDYNKLKGLIPYIAITIIMIEIAWIDLILPYVKDVNMAGTEFIFFANRRIYESVNYLYGLVWLGIYLILFIYLSYCKKVNWYIFTVCVMLMLNFSYKVYYNDRVYAIEKSKEAECCYEFIQKINNNAESDRFHIYKSECNGERLQFYLNRYPIHDIGELYSSPDNIVFCKELTDTELLEKVKDDYLWYYIELDDALYALVCEDVARIITDDVNLVLKELQWIYE